MSREERTGKRDLTYSAWHRTDNLKAFIGFSYAVRTTVVDIDWCEYCAICREPVALIETTRDDSGRRTNKPGTVTGKLAARAGVPAFVVYYSASGEGTTATMTGFRVQDAASPGAVRTMSESEYAWFLWSLHEAHRCDLARTA